MFDGGEGENVKFGSWHALNHRAVECATMAVQPEDALKQNGVIRNRMSSSVSKVA